MISVLAWIGLGLLVANGMMAILGIPPIAMWRKKPHVCDKCDGKGWVTTK